MVAKRLYICTCNFGVDLYKIDIMYMHVILIGNVKICIIRLSDV